jgi:hypothetical protein
MTMKVARRFSNPNAPKTKGLGAQLLEFSGLQCWFRPDVLSAPVQVSDGKIAYLGDRKGSAIGLKQTAEASKPVLVPGVLAGYSVASFDGSDDFFAYDGALPDWTKPFAVAILFRASATPSNTRYLIGRGTDIGARTQIHVTATNEVLFVHGDAVARAPYVRGTWGLLLASTDGVTARIRCNGVSGVPVATNNGAGPVATNIGVGNLNWFSASGPFMGEMAEAPLFFNVDLLANLPVVSMIEKLAVKLYGLPFAALRA